eukprot:5426331-Pyramimonas_sp.AAC.1
MLLHLGAVPRRGDWKLHQKAPGAVPKDKKCQDYNINEKKRQDFDISTPPRTPRTRRGSAGAASSSA